VVTYDPATREYLLGEILSDYRFDPKKFKEHPHTRAVEWKTRVSRDILSVATRNSLGSTLTLFLIPDEAVADIWAASKTDRPLEISGGLADKKEQLQQSNKDAAQEALDLVEDKILELDEYEMQDLVAALMRAMGYKTRISARGPDRGVDVIASPDGLGFQEPRIKVEVKHRPKSGMGAPDIRSFQQTLRGNYKGLYVSTGGFSREAHYEAERSETPVTLIDLTALAQLVTEHYERFDPVGRTLVPLVRIYRPAE
jgi:restriction system protein